MAGAFRYDALPVVDAFERVSDPGIYTPLPDDWRVGVTDVANSTEALGAGRYKAVNMAGAAVVSAVMNALDHAPFPFVFGGDGAVIAVPPESAERTRTAMAATVRLCSPTADVRPAISSNPEATGTAVGSSGFLRQAGQVRSPVRTTRVPQCGQTTMSMATSGGDRTR